MSSKKKGNSRSTSSRGRKGFDESEKLVSGNGWTQAATQKYLELDSDDSRLEHVKSMFSVSDDEYKYDFKSTSTVDFHFANALYCQDHGFELLRFQFVCRTLHRMYEQGVKSVTENPELDFENLRTELFNMFRAAFTQFNQQEFLFSTSETAELIKFITTSFLRPLRLVLSPYYLKTHTGYILEMKKVFRPVEPVPLDECVQEFDVTPEDELFPIVNIPQGVETIDMATMKQIIRQYTDDMVKTIEKRYDTLEGQMAKLNEINST